MGIRNIEDLPAALGPADRVFGLDLGTRTIGVAVSDGGRRVATFVATLARTRLAADLQGLRALAQGRDITGIILGLPVNMDGSEGPRCQATRQFARDLLAGWDVALAFWDERLSTAAVERAMIADDLSRKKRKKIVDGAAATYILQGALDRLAFGRP